MRELGHTRRTAFHRCAVPHHLIGDTALRHGKDRRDLRPCPQNTCRVLAHMLSLVGGALCGSVDLVESSSELLNAACSLLRAAL
jgi:hypothetical protein